MSELDDNLGLPVEYLKRHHISSAKLNGEIRYEFFLLWEIYAEPHLLTIFVADENSAKAFGARLFGHEHIFNIADRSKCLKMTWSYTKVNFISGQCSDFRMGTGESVCDVINTF